MEKTADATSDCGTARSSVRVRPKRTSCERGDIAAIVTCVSWPCGGGPHGCLFPSRSEKVLCATVGGSVYCPKPVGIALHPSIRRFGLARVRVALRALDSKIGGGRCVASHTFRESFCRERSKNRRSTKGGACEPTIQN
eukprot:scaffold7572_cov124-Isochrysis_galbana.AAC.9